MIGGKRRIAVICLIVVVMCVSAVWATDTGKSEDRNMEGVYEWSTAYIRALTIMNERLYREKDLEAMYRLHAVLMSMGTNVTEAEIHCTRLRPNIPGITSADQREYWSQWENIIRKDFWNHQERREKGDMTAGDVILPWVEVREGWFDEKN